MAVRRLTRRRLARIEPWAETEADDSHGDVWGDPTLDGCPTAEEEPRLLLEQVEYYDSLGSQPFDLNDGSGRDPFDDAAKL